MSDSSEYNLAGVPEEPDAEEQPSPPVPIPPPKPGAPLPRIWKSTPTVEDQRG